MKAFKDQDVVIALLPALEIRQQRRVIIAAMTVGIDYLEASLSGLDSLSLKIREIIPMSKENADIFAYLKFKRKCWTAISTNIQIFW